MNTQISNDIYTEDSPLMGGQSDAVDSIEEPLVVPQGSASVSQVSRGQSGIVIDDQDV